MADFETPTDLMNGLIGDPEAFAREKAPPPGCTSAAAKCRGRRS